MRKLIAKLSIKIFDFIHQEQQKKHKKKMEQLKRLMKGSCCGKKSFLNSAATLAIKDETEVEKKVDKDRIKNILKTFIDDKDPKNGVENLFNYIKGANTKVYKIKNANKILNFIGEDEGFILPKKGFKALYLNLILDKKFAFKTPELFVLRNFNVNIYALCYQFYNWYSYKIGLKGFDEESQNQFKNVFKIVNSKKIETLSYEEILNLKTAIKRDVEAIDFVINLAKSNDMAKKNLEKIKSKEKVRI